MTDPNAPVSDMTIREMMALEIANALLKQDANRHQLDILKGAVDATDQLIEILNEGGK